MNVYERIFNIVNLLKEVETGISINKISEILGMPTEIIREDIKNIYKDTKFEISIFPYDDTLDTDDFMDELSLGKHDDVDLCADDFDDEYCTLTLTPLENVVWKSVLHKKDNNDDIKIKRLYADDVGICGKVIIIQNAMNKNVNIKIRYNSKQGILNKEIPPVKIVKFIDKNLFYLISIENGELAYYRIDRMIDIQLTKTKSIVSDEDLKLLDIFDYSWGMDNDGNITDIKLRISKTANVAEKIKFELRNRKYGVWEDVDENYCYYTDKILGIGSFKAWLRNYGSSVMVMEPISLAEEMYDAALKKREVYLK